MGFFSCNTKEICWFCRKDRHDECMKNIPMHNKNIGPHDCSFDTMIISCKCNHKNKL